MASCPVYDFSFITKKYRYIIKIMVTSIAGTCIFLRPYSSSLSDVEITSEDSIKIEINDFKRTVKKMVTPLSVIVILKRLRLYSNNIFPLFANGINIEIKKGYKKRSSDLFIKNKKLDLKIIATRILNIK